MRKFNKLIMILAILLALPLADIIYNACRNDAKYLTEVSYGPFAYRDEIYVFSDLSTFPDENDTNELDFIYEDFTDLFTAKRLFYKSAEILPELIGDVEDAEHDYLKVRKDIDEYAVKVSELERIGAVDQIVSQYDEFIVWECKERYYNLEELNRENADYGYELQRFSLEKQYVKDLIKESEDTAPRLEDFKRNNTVYLLQAGTPDMSDFLYKYYSGVYRVPGTSEIYGTRLNPDFYVGILFLEDGKLYFENYDNEIKGETKDVVLNGIEMIPQF